MAACGYRPSGHQGQDEKNISFENEKTESFSPVREMRNRLLVHDDNNNNVMLCCAPLLCCHHFLYILNWVPCMEMGGAWRCSLPIPCSASHCFPIGSPPQGKNIYSWNAKEDAEKGTQGKFISLAYFLFLLFVPPLLYSMLSTHTWMMEGKSLVRIFLHFHLEKKRERSTSTSNCSGPPNSSYGRKNVHHPCIISYNFILHTIGKAGCLQTTYNKKYKHELDSIKRRKNG